MAASHRESRAPGGCLPEGRLHEKHPYEPTSPELELELIRSHIAQKPVLLGEVGARALRVQSVSLHIERHKSLKRST